MLVRVCRQVKTLIQSLRTVYERTFFKSFERAKMLHQTIK